MSPTTTTTTTTTTGFYCLLITVLMSLFLPTTPTNIIVCHDCSGVEECDWLLQNKWTGRCQALVTGKCFIRRDPNGLLYRGCADALNWPHSLDLSYNGCKYQTYGEWSDKEVYWCFCDHSLCNTNITYILNRFPTQQQQQQPNPTGQAVSWSVSGQVQGQGHGGLLADVPPPTAQRPPAAVRPLVYVLPPGTPPAGKELLPRPIIIQKQPAVISRGTSVNWEAVLSYINEARQNAGRSPVIFPGYPPSRPVGPQPGYPLPVPTVPVQPPGGLYPPRFPPAYGTTRLPPYGGAGVGGGGGVSGVGGGGLFQTTTPSLKTVSLPTVNVTGGQRYTIQQLVEILNTLLRELGLSTVQPVPGGVQGQLVFDLPPDVLSYLQANLPRGTNNVQTLPYPLYIILYLLSLSGYNLGSVLPGYNATGSDLLPTMAGDIPVPTNAPTTSLDAICPVDFIKQPSLGSCYKVFSARSDAKPVAESRGHCKQLSRLATLASIETVQERVFLAGLLRQQPAMLEGWQGWWTSGFYRDGVNQFFWETGGVIANTNDFWGFQRPPFRDTCVWVLQIPNYNYTLANYDCFTSSGHICEISLASVNANRP